jgi:hypothetical protein
MHIALAIVISAVIINIVIYIVTHSSWNLRRVLRKYRNDLPKMDTYRITASTMLFGPPFYSSTHLCKAYNLQHATERYFRWYRRKYKALRDKIDKYLEPWSKK